MPSAFVAAVLKTALSQDGVREARAANTGPKVNEYLRSVGLPPGNPWCAAFVYWAVSTTTGRPGDAVPLLRSGYCPAIHSWAREHGITHTRPEVGDAFLVLANYPEGLFASHIGLVTAVNGARFATIEGNTNDGNSNEGDGVYRRDRPVNSRHVFVRWADMLPTTTARTVEAYRLRINGVSVADLPVRNGRSLCPLATWAAHWGLTIAWDAETQTVSIDGTTVAAVLIGGRSYAPITDLVRGTGLTLAVDVAAHTVTVTGKRK